MECMLGRVGNLGIRMGRGRNTRSMGIMEREAKIRVDDK